MGMGRIRLSRGEGLPDIDDDLYVHEAEDAMGGLRNVAVVKRVGTMVSLNLKRQSSKTSKMMVVPVWQTRSAIGVVSVISFLIGLSILLQGSKALPNPAYAVMNQAASWWIWGLFFVIPGAVSLPMIFTRFRHYARGWLLWIGGLEMFMGCSLTPFGIHHPHAILSILVFFALALLSFLAALKASLLP